MQLRGKIALITGGANGIGYELGTILAAEGVNVFSFDRALPAKKVPGVRYIRADITKRDHLERALKGIRGRIDVLVNNAGIMRRGTLFDVSEADWDALFAVNIKAPWLLLLLAQKKLASHAVIVNISSRHGLHLTADPGVYALAKATVLIFSSVLKITKPQWKVKTACFGPVDTQLHRHGRDVTYLENERRAGTVCTPGMAAEKLYSLIRSKREQLIFDPEHCSYRFA